MNTFKIGNKKITFYKGKIDGMDCLAYSEDLSGKTFLFWSHTKLQVPKNSKEAVEYIESLDWEIDNAGEFSEDNNSPEKAYNYPGEKSHKSGVLPPK